MTFKKGENAEIKGRNTAPANTAKSEHQKEIDDEMRKLATSKFAQDNAAGRVTPPEKD